MIDDIKWYLSALERELVQLKEGKFTGNIIFQINWRDGSIANSNINLNKSLKRIEN